MIKGRTLANLACLDLNIPEAGMVNDFLGTLRQLNMLIMEEEINRLLAKAAQEGLSEEEKLELTAWIARKKQLPK